MFFNLKRVVSTLLLVIVSNYTFGFTSSNLPILIINTHNQSIVRYARVDVTIGITYNGAGQRNYTTDPFNHFQGNAQIRTRGNATANWPKKAYDFKIVDNQGDDLNVPLLGMAAHEDWILLASYLDHTFIRTPLAKHMSRLAGRWASNCRMVEVIMDGEHQGIYILIEKIKRSNRRLGVERLEPYQVTQPDITGGYIFEISGQKNSLGETRHLKYPKFEYAAPEQIAYIKDYDNGFRNAMRMPNYTNEYPKWIDVDSFVDELIVQEAMRNSDAYGWSAYFHKHREGKLFAGPVWDFDQSAGNSSYPDDGVVEGWLYSHESTNNTPFFWELLMQDPVFSYKVKKRWETLRKNEYKTENLHHYIDSIALLLSEAQAREFAKWPVLGVNFWRETNGYRQRDTYQKEVNYLKSFLSQRWAWMDNELAKIPDITITTSVNGYENAKNSILLYPNPAYDNINLTLHSPNSANATIRIFSPLGMLVGKPIKSELQAGLNYIDINLSSINSNGVLIYLIQTDDGQEHVGRFIKK